MCTKYVTVIGSRYNRSATKVSTANVSENVFSSDATEFKKQKTALPLLYVPGRLAAVVAISNKISNFCEVSIFFVIQDCTCTFQFRMRRRCRSTCVEQKTFHVKDYYLSSNFFGTSFLMTLICVVS